jgi:tRNA 2-thiouridine synthesizing protein A
MPDIRVQGMVAMLAPGDEVVAICSDPGALNDIPAWCRVNGHVVVDCRADDGEVVVVVKIGSGG